MLVVTKAPRHISVHRKEIFEEIRQANIAAAASREVEVGTLQKLLGTFQETADGEAPAPGEEDKPDDDQ